jgi:hypothetical protein
MNNPTVPTARETLKQKIKDALRKTGHVAESGLDAVAETAAAIALPALQE